MDISVNDLTSVDKELTIKATREDLQPTFDKAYKKYRGQINLPGFRPGKVPLGLVKKRFGKEIEAEEIQNYVMKLYENEIVEKYNPVGESQFEEISWENDELEVKLKIGIAPEFDLVDPTEVEVEKMVHDVTDEEVKEEIEHLLEKEGDWKETDAIATEKSKVVVDVTPFNEDGELNEDDIDEDQEMDLSSEEHNDFKEHLIGLKAGDSADVELKEGEKYQLDVKNVMELEKAELTDELVEQVTNGQVKEVDGYESFLKSQIQDYYDQVSEDTAKNSLMTKMVDAHEFEVPQVLVDQVIKKRVEDIKKQYQIEADLDIESYRDSFQDQSVKDSKWHFITEKLSERYDDIELEESDVDAYFEKQAAQMGVAPDMLKNVYASNPNELESLRRQIREEKVYERVLDEVKIHEISKEEYQKKAEEKKKESEEA